MTTLELIEEQIANEVEALQTLAKLQEDEESFHYLGKEFFDRRYTQIQDNLATLKLQLAKYKVKYGGE